MPGDDGVEPRRRARRADGRRGGRPGGRAPAGARSRAPPRATRGCRTPTASSGSTSPRPPPRPRARPSRSAAAERQVDVVAEEEIARRRAATRRTQSDSRPRRLREGSRGSARGRSRSSRHSTSTTRSPAARSALASASTVRRPGRRRRGRGGRRRCARARRPCRGERYVSASTTPSAETTGPSAPTRVTAAGRERARVCGEEADRDRLRETRQRDLVGHVLAERDPKRHVDEVDADRVADELRELRGRRARCRSDHGHLSVRRRDELDEPHAVAQPEHALPRAPPRARRRRAGRSGSARAGRAPRRPRIPVPSGRRRSESVRSRTAPSRATTTAFISVPSTNRSSTASCDVDSASAAWRWDSRSPGSSIRNSPCWRSRVGGLEHRGQPDRVERGAALRQVPRRREGRLRQPLLGKGAPQRELVGEAVRGVPAEGREPEALRDDGDDRHRTVARERQQRRRPRGCARASSIAAASPTSATSATSARPRPSACGSSSTATTRWPRPRTWTIAARWSRPAPTRRTPATARC